MTGEQWLEFYGKVTALFPGKLNADQLVEWKDRMGGLDLAPCMTALSDYYAGAKAPSDGPQPSLAGVMRCYRANNPAREQEHQETGEETFWQLTRRRWMKENPYKAVEISRMSDLDVEVYCTWHRYEESLRVCGRASNSAVARYWQWQHACFRNGQRAEWPEELIGVTGNTGAALPTYSAEAARLFREEQPQLFEKEVTA